MHVIPPRGPPLLAPVSTCQMTHCLSNGWRCKCWKILLSCQGHSFVDGGSLPLTQQRLLSGALGQAYQRTNQAFLPRQGGGEWISLRNSKQKGIVSGVAAGAFPGMIEEQMRAVGRG